MSPPRPQASSVAERPPHAPEVGWAARFLGDFHVTGLFWYRLHRWAAGALPGWAFAPVIRLFTTLFFFTIVKIRRAIAANLVPVLGPAGWLERQLRIYRTMHAFAWCLTERYERLVTDRPFRLVIEGEEHWHAVADTGEGFVMVTAHLGLYEVGSMVPAMREARRVHLVREPEVDPRAQEFIKQSVAAVEGANYCMHFQTGDPLQGVVLAEALQRGELVAVQADRPRAGGKTVDATLFGRPFTMPVGPAVLARTAGVRMLPVFAIREGRRFFRIVCRPPIDVPRTADRAADIAVALRRVAVELENGIRRVPHQWFVFRELWPSGG
ncbi:MAG TPA: lysophospholipid acyltransferase family protein [Burkholderiales bacterium]|nr:lysophospholipid acyltransferase family protein [Burkholderiales bacterium]